MVGGTALFWNGHVPLLSQSSLVSSAEARIGRPLTPMSYAGVGRRTTRRAVAVGAGAAAVGAATVYAALRPHVRRLWMTKIASPRAKVACAECAARNAVPARGSVMCRRTTAPFA